MGLPFSRPPRMQCRPPGRGLKVANASQRREAQPLKVYSSEHVCSFLREILAVIVLIPERNELGLVDVLGILHGCPAEDSDMFTWRWTRAQGSDERPLLVVHNAIDRAVAVHRPVRWGLEGLYPQVDIGAVVRTDVSHSV